MSVQTAPYNDSMRVGSGFNSYTQQLCVDDAVIKDDRTSATDKDLKPKLSKENNVSQQVSFTSKFVEHSSDVTEAMNISGSLEIKYQGIGVKGSGAYVDSSKVKDSDINFFVQVKVVNQQLIADDVTKFNAIENVPAKDQKRFTDIYGDSFISGFLEGGEFNALLSVKVSNKSKLKEIKGSLSLNLEKAGFGVKGEASGEYKDEEIIKSSETSISVAWAGGGEIRDSKATGWTIDSMAAAAFAFADKVRQCPQRTHAILTKYTALRSYQVLTNKGSPLDYENAGVYTNSLLEGYLEYKGIWKNIQASKQQPLPPPLKTFSEQVGNGSKRLVKLPTGEQTSNDIKTLKQKFTKLFEDADPKPTFNHLPEDQYEPTLASMETALWDCRLQMIRIVKEVDAVSEDPKIAVDTSRVGQYLSPVLFRQLLPGVELRPTEEEFKKLCEQVETLQKQLENVSVAVDGKEGQEEAKKQYDTLRELIEQKMSRKEAANMHSLLEALQHKLERFDQKKFLPGPYLITNAGNTSSFLGVKGKNREIDWVNKGSSAKWDISPVKRIGANNQYTIRHIEGKGLVTAPEKPSTSSIVECCDISPDNQKAMWEIKQRNPAEDGERPRYSIRSVFHQGMGLDYGRDSSGTTRPMLKPIESEIWWHIEKASSLLPT